MESHLARLRTFAFPLNANPSTVWRGHIFSKNFLAIYPISAELEAVSQPGLSTIELSFSGELPNNICQMLGFPDLDKLLVNKESLIYQPMKLKVLHKSVLQIIREVRINP